MISLLSTPCIWQVLVLRLQTAGSIEERVAAVAGSKRSFADQAITGGFFDGQTSTEMRRQYLVDLLRSSSTPPRAGQSPTTQSHLSDADIERLLLRGDTTGVHSACIDDSSASRAAASSSAGDCMLQERSAEQGRLASAAEVAPLVAEAELAAAAPAETLLEELGRGKRRGGTPPCAPEKAVKRNRLVQPGERADSETSGGLSRSRRILQPQLKQCAAAANTAGPCLAQPDQAQEVCKSDQHRQMQLEMDSPGKLVQDQEVSLHVELSEDFSEDMASPVDQSCAKENIMPDARPGSSLAAFFSSKPLMPANDQAFDMPVTCHSTTGKPCYIPCLQ